LGSLGTDPEDLRGWIGRSETLEAEIGAMPMLQLRATLDREAGTARKGEAVPPAWHWLYFPPLTRQSDLGEDGHARRGGFLPPVPLPRRMWAGGSLDLHRPLRVGDVAVRRSEIVDVTAKEGRTAGPLIFVTVRHTLSVGAEPCIVETQDLVYRNIARGEPSPEAAPAPSGADWSRTLIPTSVLLFRFSALTFNTHRIHYDHPYATEVEGYPGLVVHGPLLALLMLDLVVQQFGADRVASFRFQSRRPVFVPQPLTISARRAEDGCDTWVENGAGAASQGYAALR
jgi:3-methylfumaryl-CoA hydratase